MSKVNPGEALDGGRFCIVCEVEPIPETRVAFRGSKEYLVAALESLGIDPLEALEIISDNRRRLIPEVNQNARSKGTGSKGLGVKWYGMAVTCCAECAGKIGLEVGTRADKDIPCYRTREGIEDE